MNDEPRMGELILMLILMLVLVIVIVTESKIMARPYDAALQRTSRLR